MLPSDAPMPPCAATVCERVGNTFDSTTTFRPAIASCSEARMPAPPEPMITTSNLRCATDERRELTLKPPQHLNRPSRTADQPHDGEHLQRKTRHNRVHVIHEHVAHADPHVVQHGHDDDEGQHLHPLH